VLIAYDRDDAGNKAADKLAVLLMAEGIECFRVLFPKDSDANSFALENKPADKSLGLVLRSAQWMGKGKEPEKVAKQEKESEVKTKPESEKTPEIKPEPESEQNPIPSLAAGSCSSEPTQASPLPAVAEDIEAEVSEHEVKISLGDRHYRIRGLSHNNGYEQLKINLRVTWGEFFYVDTLDLYLGNQRTTYIKHAGMELSLEVNLLNRDLGKILLKLEALQDEHI
jgi:hypothetical protein